MIDRDDRGPVLAVCALVVLVLGSVLIEHFWPARKVEATIVATGVGDEAPRDTLTDYVVLKDKSGVGAHAALVAWIKSHTEWDVSCVTPITDPHKSGSWPGTDGLLIVAKRRRS